MNNVSASADAGRPGAGVASPGMLGRLRRHRVVRRTRALARDLVWRIKGRAIVNPPLPAPVHSILFVCLGNICRSPFAEGLARVRLAGRGRSEVRCASAGLRTRQAAEPPADARGAAEPYGISLTSHRPQPLTTDLLASHDLVIVFESGQLDAVRSLDPAAVSKTLLLSLFDSEAAGFERYHIVDPFSRPREAYEHCYARIDRALSCLLDAVVPTLAGGSGTSADVVKRS